MKASKHLSILLLAMTAAPAAFADQWTGRWSPTFNWPVIPIHAALMPNGKVFSFGTTGDGIQQAYIYDVWTPGWEGGGDHQTLPNNQNVDTFCSAVNLLPNGNVLVAGGDTRVPESNGIRDSLVLQSNNNTIARAPYMQFPRWYPTLTTLPNGETLISGGRETGGQPIATPEIYNGNWRTLWGATSADITTDVESKWYFPRTFVAPNGRIFGMTGNQMYFLDWAGNGGVQLAGSLPDKSRSHTSTAVMYRPGQIFQAGGSTNGDTQAEGSRQAITVDINGGWPNVQPLPDMGFRRVWANSTVLPNGEVLITGGSAFDNREIEAAKMAEMWNPDSRQFRQLRPSAQVRMYHSVSLLLPDGSVLVGGGGAPGPYTHKNAEIYYPPYLFQGNDFAPRPTTGNFNLNQNYGNPLDIPTGGAGAPARVVFIRTGAVTHSFNQSQRFMELPFQNLGGSIRVTMPNSPNIAPPGYYMLFVLNGAGVPSVAKIVSLNAQNPGPGGGAVDLPAGMQDGAVYELVARHSNKCVDVAQGGNPANGTDILQWECTGGANQRFRLEKTVNNAHRLVNIQTNKCIDVAIPNPNPGADIVQWECTGATNQAFRFLPSANGSFKLKYEHNGRCMDVGMMSPDNGANVLQWDCIDGNANQDFQFRQVTAVTPPPAPAGPRVAGVYELVLRHSGKCMDVAENGNPANGTNILQWQCTGGQNQKYRLENAANGAFRLVNAKTNKCVDVDGPSAANGANIHQWDCTGGTNQAFRFVPAPNGTYKIKYEHSGRCADVDGISQNNGANIHQWDCIDGNGNQDFMFRGG